MPHVRLNVKIDLDEKIRRFARFHLRGLKRMELTNIQTQERGAWGPELDSIQISRGARILAVKKKIFFIYFLEPQPSSGWVSRFGRR